MKIPPSSQQKYLEHLELDYKEVRADIRTHDNTNSLIITLVIATSIGVLQINTPSTFIHFFTPSIFSISVFYFLWKNVEHTLRSHYLNSLAEKLRFVHKKSKKKKENSVCYFPVFSMQDMLAKHGSDRRFFHSLFLFGIAIVLPLLILYIGILYISTTNLFPLLYSPYCTERLKFGAFILLHTLEAISITTYFFRYTLRTKIRYKEIMKSITD